MKSTESRSRFGRRTTSADATRTSASADVIPLRNSARSFIVLTTQRTGSSWLMDLINNLPGVEGHMELFYHDRRREPPRAGCNTYPRFVESRDAFARGHRPLAVFRYLAGLYERGSAAGFKLMYSQLREYPEILPFIAARRLPVIHLLRNNHLDVLISEALADATGSSHATESEAARQQQHARLHLDPVATVDGIRRLERKQRFMRALLRALPNPVLETSYEDLCANEAAFERICDFLRVHRAVPAALGSRLVKRQQASHREVLENFDAVRDALTAGGYAGLLR